MSWHLSGNMVETCNCALLCPCILDLTTSPTEGDCRAAIAFKIDKGEKEGVNLDGLSFIYVLLAPGPMADGGHTAGVIIDENADDEQTKALTEIATGEVGGPMEAFGALISNNAGIEKRPITFSQDGMKHSVQAGDLVDQSCEAIAGAVNENEPISLDNVPHPSGARLPLAKAIKTSINVFGITWNDDSGIRNGHINTFSWSN
tara:strand:- start:540 stop:1148 length:609 start_codon:yes stop_codon:yes gene_type:complete